MIRIIDTAQVNAVRETKEGYLVAESRVARTGVQNYLARELGDVALNAGFAPDDVVRVYRHADQVFSPETLKSITRMPVTIDHPAEAVTADNWNKYAVGEVGDAYRIHGEWVIVNPMIKDSAAIDAVRNTHRQISMGYETKIVPVRDGIDADFEMADIRYNHLAAVRKGRAGEQARIGDAWGITPIEDFKPGSTPTTKGDHKMSDTLKTVVLGDKAVQVAVSDVAAIEQFKLDSAKALSDAKTAHDAAIAAKDTEIGTLRAELKEAKDAANIDVDKLVADRADLVAKVKAIDSKIETAGKTDAELRKAAVAAKMGDEMVKDASDDTIRGMFAVVAKDAKTNPASRAFNDGLSGSTSALDDAYAAYDARMSGQKKE